MSALMELKTRPQQIQDDVIDKLENALAQARRGEIIGVAIAATSPDGAISVGYSQSDDIGRILGAVTYLQHRLCIESF